MSPRSRSLPPDVGPLDIRFQQWFEQELGVASRKVSERVATFPVADTQVRVRHNLPAIPTGYRVIQQSEAASIYNTRKPDRFYVYLKSDTAGVTVTIEIS